MNSLSNDDINKINKLKQKLYSRSINENASKLNLLHKHNITVPSSWDEKKEIKDIGLEKIASIKENKESISDFLNKKFDNVQNDDFSTQRANELENKMQYTNIALKSAEAKLLNKNSLYPNLNKDNKIKNDINVNVNNDFQSDYHPDFKTVKIGENADQQDVDDNGKNKKTGLSISFILFSLISLFFFTAVIYTYITISKGTNTISTNKININITGPVSVKSGEVVDFIVDITNNNNTEVILSDLYIQYPVGSKSPKDRSQDFNNERISVGKIKPGETVRQKNSVIFFGEQNVKKNILYSYEFNINDSATIFKTEKNIGVFIVGNPISLKIDNIKEINNNQELTFDIILESNTEDDLKNIQLKVEYPFGYKLLDSNIKPDSDNNTWSFEKIEPLSSKSIKLKGKFLGEINVDKNFRFILGIEDSKTKEMLTVLSTQDNIVEIRKPFVTTQLSLNGDNSDIKSVDYDQNIGSILTVTNNLSEAITDVVVEVLVNGVLIERNNINSNDGFFDSGKNIILWDKSLNKNLTKISPGQSVDLSFNLSTIKDDENFIKNLKRANSEIIINVKAQRLAENRVIENVIATTKKELRLITNTSFESKIFYEKGNFPPEREKETVYKYVGYISNTSNEIKNVEFITKLPPNSTWKGVYGPNIPKSSIKYNSSTREVSIKLNNIESGVGINKSAKEFYFNIGFTPSLTQVGQLPPILITPTITAEDSFTGNIIQIKNKSINTSITDGIYSDTEGKVK